MVQAIDGDVRPLLTKDFRRGDDVPLGEAPRFRRPAADREVQLAPIAAIVEAAMEKFASHPTKSDAWLGPRVHATLRLTRREATDGGMWAWLHVLAFPKYVRWRWAPQDEETPIPFNRFIGDDSNSGLKRLWWASEIARDGSNYEPAVRALGVQRFDLWQRLVLMHHKACALAAVDFLAGRRVTSAQSIAMAKAMNVAVRTTSLDALAPSPPADTHAMRAWVREPIDETTMMVDLPVGPDEQRVSPAAVASARAFIDEIATRIQLQDVTDVRDQVQA
jgi:hypothetical protein